MYWQQQIYLSECRLFVEPPDEKMEEVTLYSSLRIATICFVYVRIGDFVKAHSTASQRI